MTKKQKKRSIKWGYSLIIISLAFIIASGVMYYLYQKGEAPTSPTNKGTVAGKVKAAGDGEWSSTWSANFNGQAHFDRVGDWVSEDINAQEVWGNLYEAVDNRCDPSSSNYSERSCSDFVKNNIQCSVRGEDRHGVEGAFGQRFLVKNWTVDGNINGSGFHEEWTINHVWSRPMFFCTDTNHVAHSCLYFTGKGMLMGRELAVKWQVFMGTEHSGIGTHNDYLSQERWIDQDVNPNWLINHWVYYNGSWRRAGQGGHLKKFLWGDQGRSDFNYGVGAFEILEMNATPASWTVSGSFE